MKNKKAFELAISTLILIILGIILLIALVYVVTGGFKTFNTSTKPFTDTTQASAIKQGCQLACDNSDKITFCTKEYQMEKEKIRCTDPRLQIACPSIAC